MNLSFKRIAALSRDHAFQFKTVVIILLAGMAVAFGISLWRGGDQVGKYDKMWEHLFEKKGSGITSRRDCVKLLETARVARQLHQDRFSRDEPGMPEVPAAGDLVDLMGGMMMLNEREGPLLIDYFTVLVTFSEVTPETLEKFKAAAAAEPVSGLLSSMHGDLLRLAGKYEESLTAYERGATDTETGADSRRRALDLCHRQNWKEKLQHLYYLPGWREAVLERGAGDERDNYETAVAAGDWTGVLRMVWDMVWGQLKSPLWVTMAALTGLLWFLVIHIAAAVPVRRWWLGLAGLGCGLLSIPVTHIFATMQETWLNGQEHGHGLNDILYCVSGIGLREELAKLLLFVPLLPFLRKLPAAQVLAVAASVGLGFAALENVQYFQGYSGSSVWGRFITANFLHLALTGLAGLALWQTVRDSRWLTHFAGVFIAAVVFHGLWDFRPMDDRIAGDYGYFIILGLAGLALYFFRELCRYTEPKPGVPSAVFVYLAGGALLLSVLMACLSWDTGFRLALVDTFDPVLQLFAIGAAMFYQLRRA